MKIHCSKVSFPPPTVSKTDNVIGRMVLTFGFGAAHNGIAGGWWNVDVV